MNIRRILKSPRIMSALTGTTPEEFKGLLPTFMQVWTQAKWDQHETYATERNIGGGRKGFLKTMEEKLFFILFYYKCYPTYDLLGVIFDCNRSNACRRQFELSVLLEKTLGKKLVLPERQMRTVEEFHKAFPKTQEIFIDGTERPIQRPKNKERQARNYSGKKKRHTKKNIVITDKNKRVGFLSKTANGKSNDFTMLKEYSPPDHMPKDVLKHLDLGFQGIEKQFPGHKISMPKKKPRGGELTESEKEENKEKSSVRVLIENSLSGVKRARIVADIFRNRRKYFNDLVMNISCGLWNYHLLMR
jgi:hypothetical protein